MRTLNLSLPLLVIFIFTACPLIQPYASAELYVFVMDSVDSSYIEDADVYFLPNLTDFSDSLGLTGRFNYASDLKRYWGPVDREIPAGYIYTKALGYQSDTTRIGKTDHGETRNVHIYLKENY